jgi:hypothetical protein
MKSLVIVLLAASAFLCKAETNGQNVAIGLFKPMPQPISGVQFDVSLNIQELAAGRTNVLMCKLSNRSTTNIAYFEPAKAVILVLLTNGFGQSFQLSPELESHSSDKQNRPVYEFTIIKAGSSNVWEIPIMVKNEISNLEKKDGKQLINPDKNDKSIPPGEYCLYASIAYYTSDARYVRGLQSNILKVRLK